jgi:hypothetical protein
MRYKVAGYKVAGCGVTGCGVTGYKVAGYKVTGCGVTGCNFLCGIGRRFFHFPVKTGSKKDVRNKMPDFRFQIANYWL